MKTKVILRAKTNSEFDSCDLAIVDLALLKNEELSRRIAWVKQASEDTDFFCMSFWFWGTDFLRDIPVAAGKFLSERYLPKDASWTFISDIVVDFDAPESQLDGFEVIFTKGGVYFAADGKHTGERFWTEEIPMAVIEQFIIDRTPVAAVE